MLTLSIPTYNRASFLKKLLKQIVLQASHLDGQIQICISDNASTDNTKLVVDEFQNNYPGLIKYQKNEENLGFAKNFIKAAQMADGKFIWFLGDDDLLSADGVKKVLGFINKYCNDNTGLIAIGNKSFFVDESGKENVYFINQENNKPKIYEIKPQEVIEQTFPNNTYISVLILNKIFLNKIISEESEAIRKALEARDYIQNFLYQLMFLKYRQLTAVRFNEIIVEEELHYYKFYIEDRFGLHYAARKKLNDLLLAMPYMDSHNRKLIENSRNQAVKNMIVEMAIMKIFKTYNYTSFWGCIKMFFRESSFRNALFFSVFFMVFAISPSFILKLLYKNFLKIRLKEKWPQVWFSLEVAFSKMAQGTRRQLS